MQPLSMMFSACRAKLLYNITRFGRKLFCFVSCKESTVSTSYLREVLESEQIWTETAFTFDQKKKNMEKEEKQNATAFTNI